MNTNIPNTQPYTPIQPNFNQPAQNASKQLPFSTNQPTQTLPWAQPPQVNQIQANQLNTPQITQTPITQPTNNNQQIPSTIIIKALPIPFNPLKSAFDIELHKLRKQTAFYFRWGPNYERQGLILNIRNILNELLLEYIMYIKSKTKSRLYKIDALIEMLRVLWFDYYELGYLTKPLKSGRQETQIKAIKRYDFVCTQINKLGSIIGAKIKTINYKQ